jgi:hypothetical protein
MYPLPTAGSHRRICSGLVIDFEEVVRGAAGGTLFALALDVVVPVLAQPRDHDGDDRANPANDAWCIHAKGRRK